MPCSSDYLDPSRFEQECQRCAKLILFVHKQLNNFYLILSGGQDKINTPKWIKECAENCYGAPNDGQHDKRLVPYLCKLLTELEPSQRERIIYNAKDKTSRDLADWWEEHQEADKKRIRQEKEKEKQKTLTKKALSKLTKEEKLALYMDVWLANDFHAW